MFFDSIYKKGYEAGQTAERLKKQEDQNRRLEEMLKYGKEIGRNDGWREGYIKGYECGYSEGEMDAKAEVGAIDLDGIMKDADEDRDPDDIYEQQYVSKHDVYSLSELL